MIKWNVPLLFVYNQEHLHFTADYILYNCVCDEYKKNVDIVLKKKNWTFFK